MTPEDIAREALTKTLERLTKEDPGYVPDASALVLLTYPRVEPEDFGDLVSRQRPYAVEVLKAAGFCSCSKPIVTPRCPGCSSLH